MEEIKITTVGDGAVGKTCMLMSYTKNEFPDDYIPTVYDNTSTTVIVDETMINLNLWDTAGQEEYDKLRSLSYPNTDIFLICFSIDNPISFQNVKSKWYPDISKSWKDPEENVPCFLVALKTDLRNENGTYVTYEEGEQLAESINALGYVECSAKTREGLNEVFESAIREVLEYRYPSNSDDEGGCCVIV